jgi:hypothetical protein
MMELSNNGVEIMKGKVAIAAGITLIVMILGFGMKRWQNS